MRGPPEASKAVVAKQPLAEDRRQEAGEETKRTMKRSTRTGNAAAPEGAVAATKHRGRPKRQLTSIAGEQPDLTTRPDATGAHKPISKQAETNDDGLKRQ